MPASQLPPSVAHMPSSYDVSWFIDMKNGGQLELEPPYQRHSVWGLKDKRYFLDTVFRGFLCPPIYLHKTISNGRSLYAVVDGKQRIESVLAFYDNKLSLPADFGNDRLDGKKWKDIKEDPELVERFMNYSFPIELIKNISCVKEIFDRLNRNSKTLNQQELRHAKYSGWFITFAEQEVESEVWATCRVWTKGNAKRMKDVQTISELMILAIDGAVNGFDQERIDAAYALYDSPIDFEEENEWHLPSLDVEEFKTLFATLRKRLEDIIVEDSSILSFIKDTKNLYSLWAYIVRMEKGCGEPPFSLTRYKELIEFCTKMKDPSFVPNEEEKASDMYTYYSNSLGASTEAPQRKNRHNALVSLMTI